jgi:hypothetical protein
MWFAISSSHVYALPVTVLSVGLPKKKKPAILRHLISLSRVTYRAPVEMLFRVQNHYKSQDVKIQLVKF